LDKKPDWTGLPSTSRAPDDSPSLTNNHREREVVPPYEDTGPTNEVTNAVRSYSDVVASRSPSRNRQRPVLPLDGLVAGPEVSNVPIGSNNENIAYSGESEVRDSNDGVETPDKLEWTMVRRRHSLGSFRENEKRPLTSEQKKVVSMAKDSLTAEQKQKIQLQQKKVRKRDNSSSSRGEGPSEPKRKAKDPQEWGNVDFSRENLGMEAQATALEFFKRKLKDQKHSKKKTH
jgi:hypothetical protein